MKDTTKIELTKFAVKLMVTAGVTTVVRSIISNNVDTPSSTMGRIKLAAATFVIVGMIVDQTEPYVDGKIEKAANFMKAIKSAADNPEAWVSQVPSVAEPVVVTTLATP